LLAQGLASLGAGVIELARLADDDGPRADEEDLAQVGSLWHGPCPWRNPFSVWYGLDAKAPMSLRVSCPLRLCRVPFRKEGESCSQSATTRRHTGHTRSPRRKRRFASRRLRPAARTAATP